MSASNVMPFRPETREEAARPKREAKWARARARLTRATALYDRACAGASRHAINDSGSLYDAEAGLLRAVGLLTVAVEYDRKNQGGSMPREVEEALKVLSEVHIDLRLEREALEDAGVFDATLMRAVKEGT